MPVPIPVNRLAEHCDPFVNCPWVPGVILTTEMISEAIQHNRLRSTPVPQRVYRDIRQHVERIAYLAVNGWRDPVFIDVGVPSLGCYIEWPLQDGNHRFAAAIYLGKTEILGMVDGDLRYAFDLFGVDVAEYEQISA